MITHGEIGHAFTHLDNLPGALVAQHQGRREGDLAGGGGQVAMTDPAGRELHGHLISPGPVDLDGLDGDGRIPFTADGCLGSLGMGPPFARRVRRQGETSDVAGLVPGRVLAPLSVSLKVKK